MADGDARGKRAVSVFFDDDLRAFTCDCRMTMAQVRGYLQDEVGRPISVAFFSGERYLPDDRTIAEVLPSATARSLELDAFPKSTYSLQLLGSEETSTLFEVAAVLTPAAVRREIGMAVGIHTNDFRLICDGVELDEELSFKDQGVAEGARLVVKVPVTESNQLVERNFPLLTIDGVVRTLGWGTGGLLDALSTRRGLLPKAILCSGHLLSTRTKISDIRPTENTLAILDPENVIVSSEKKLLICRFAHGATYGDVRAQMQQLKGSLHLGLKSRDRRIPNEAMSRKVDRELLSLTRENQFQTQLVVTMNEQQFDCRFQAQQVCFSDVMVSVGKQTKEVPRLLFSKKLFCCGCGRQLSRKEEPHQAIPATCCSIKSLQLTDRRVKEVGIQTAVTRRRDVETFTLDAEATGDYRSWRLASDLLSFSAETVRPSNVGIHASLPRRCNVATSTADPKTRDVGNQTDVQGTRDTQTFTLDVETKDTCVFTEAMFRRAVVSATPELGIAVTAPPPSASLRIFAVRPEGGKKAKTLRVEGSNCRALLAAVDRHVAEVPAGDAPLVYSRERIFDQKGKMRRTVDCFDEKAASLVDIDAMDGGRADQHSCLLVSRRFLRPSSPLPSTPSLAPAIFIETNTDFLAAAPKRQLQLVPSDALVDLTFVAFLPGLRAHVAEGLQFFWELSSGIYINAESGRDFGLREIDGGSKRFTVALLRDKDPVPRAKVPPNELLRVFWRAGLNLRVEKGCVRCLGTQHGPKGMDLWDSTNDKNSFVTDFSTAARKK